ncbi:transcription initiation factor TFIID subunit 6-like [Drosophila sulfurigaster albostrigata]|uniref:transcription initiation factor TFIID subunit 6-like n=1 Tax=Drosophila sulfurigaster albostrigata TaxID=89887 RepID=UPI002D21BD21|nr:transcription initiation factor TFIID subunit 6-like [Drosophila sulfurigaster albostrigata]
MEEKLKNFFAPSVWNDSSNAKKHDREFRINRCIKTLANILRYEGLPPLEETKKNFAATLSDQSMNAIAETYLGTTLNKRALQMLGDILRSNVNKLMVEAVKYCRHTRATQLTVEHVQQAQIEMGCNLYMLHIDFDCEEIEDRNIVKMWMEECLLPMGNQVGLSMPIIKLPKPMLLKSDRKRLNREEIVMLQSISRYPLSRGQQKFYVETTEKLVGVSEEDRLAALKIMSLDPAVHHVLSQLAIFISEGIRVNIKENNFIILTHLLRLVDGLMRNRYINLKPYLHLILPGVVSCVVANQISAFPSVEDHWATREFAASLTMNFILHFDSDEQSIEKKVLKIYLNGLEKPMSSLTTIYGCIVGISKFGKCVFYKYVTPRIAFISDRIEPFLHDESLEKSDLRRMAANQIRLRIAMECAPILKYQFATRADYPEVGFNERLYYEGKYKYVGKSIYQAVIFSRMQDDVCDLVRAEVLEKNYSIQN